MHFAYNKGRMCFICSCLSSEIVIMSSADGCTNTAVFEGKFTIENLTKRILLNRFPCFEVYLYSAMDVAIHCFTPVC